MTDGSVPSLEPVSITIDPSSDHPDVLSVQDAMRQVLDAFDLLTPDTENSFIWNLKIASKNSPLTIIGEPYSDSASAVDIARMAYEQKEVLEENIRALSQGRHPARRLSPKRRDTIRRIFKRNLNGIGRTALKFNAQADPLMVTPATAAVGVQTLGEEEPTDFQSFLLKDRSRSEMGSLEGVLLDVGTDYHSPAVCISERHTGQQVWCRVSGDIRDRISAEMTLNDVWARSRVIVKGRIRYNSDGSFSRVWAHDLQPVKQRKVEVSDLVDDRFTGGDSIQDYLERLREGDFG